MQTIVNLTNLSEITPTGLPLFRFQLYFPHIVMEMLNKSRYQNCSSFIGNILRASFDNMGRQVVNSQIMDLGFVLGICVGHAVLEVQFSS